MAQKILFVCLGNICRSPLAHGIFRAFVEDAGVADQFHIESAGTGGWHVGKPPDARAIAVALAHNINLRDLRAQQVTTDDFYRFDHFLAMDQSNYQDLQLMTPKDANGKVSMFLSYGSDVVRQVRDVPDPYYGSDEGFEHVFQLIENAAHGLFEFLQTKAV